MTVEEEARRAAAIEADAKWWEEALPKGWLLVGWSGRFHATVLLSNGTGWQIGQREREVIERFAKIEKAAVALLDDVHKRHPGEELYCPLMRGLEDAVIAVPVVHA